MAKKKDKQLEAEFDNLVVEPVDKSSKFPMFPGVLVDRQISREGSVDLTQIPPVVELETVDHTHPDWTNYVLEHLTDDEMWDGYPRVDGLRRLVEKFYGRIVGTYVRVEYNPNPFPTVIVVASVKLETGEIHEASSDATIYSAQGEFRNKLTAIADSRAKSKAYREILRLRNVSSREEAVTEVDVEDDSDIQTTQENMINVIYPRNISVKYDTAKLIQHVLGFEKKVKELKSSEAIKVMSILNNCKEHPEQMPEVARIS